MVKRMLIDATHPEETRVVVVSGTKLDEFDFETSTKKQLKGNIYLAKVIRIEPSLQAAFVDYGGNRHGFLAFSEIHPDYYQIPVADREALLAEQERRARQSEEAESSGRRWRGRRNDRNRRPGGPREEGAENREHEEPGSETALAESEARDVVIDAGNGDLDAMPSAPSTDETSLSTETAGEWTEAGDRSTEGQGGDYRHDEHMGHDAVPEGDDLPAEDERRADAKIEWPVVRDEPVGSEPDQASTNEDADISRPTEFAGDEESHNHDERGHAGHDRHDDHDHDHDHHGDDHRLDAAGSETDELTAPPDEAASDGESGDVGIAGAESQSAAAGEEPLREPPANVETLGGEDLGEEERPRRSQSLRNYKIQEVIKRRQILLVQVVKEERGNKGAALTTYLSLAGRYCVLMPNAGRGGGISRKISNPADRKRMKEMLSELEVPNGMGVILRTAGLERSKAEIKRDYDYLVRLWDTIREVTLKSTAPALIYEEGNLIKRSIRDLYSKDIEDVLIEGEEGYRAAKDFMRQLMPSHAKKVQLYNDQTPLFHRYQVETQLDAMHSPVVQLRSGGYIVINPTEALVAIDVNSGRATKERNIEETALRTNAEAAEEIARQLRLRDLAGLIVIDFIDMEDARHQQQVERRLKEAMRSDRARIQIGRISAFGLLELSRQRLRPSLLEISTEVCPHCEGTGRVRSTESTVLHVLRGIEEEGIRRRAAEIRVAVPTAVALYLLNQKRGALAEIEQRYGLRVFVDGDESLIPPHYKLERIRSRPIDHTPVPLSMTSAHYVEEPADEVEDIDDETPAESATESAADGEEPVSSHGEAPDGSEDAGPDGRRRRRRRRRRRPEDGPIGATGEIPGMGEQPPVLGHDMVPEAAIAAPADNDDGNDEDDAELTPEQAAAGGEDSEANRRRRRRGRRGGRRRRHGDRDGQGNPLPGADPDNRRGPQPRDFEHEQNLAAAPVQHDNRDTTVPMPADEQQPQVSPAARTVEPEYYRSTEIATPSERPVEHHSQPDVAVEPVPAAETADAVPAGPPRRGWWQRLTTRE